MCSKAAKDTPTEGAGMLYKGRSAGKRVEESRGRKSSMHGQAMRSIARMEEELSGKIEEEGEGALRQGGTRRSTPTRVKIVYGRSNSDICTM